MSAETEREPLEQEDRWILNLRGLSVAPLTPESQDVAAALPLFGAKVLSAVAFKYGGLRVVFDSGTHLNCAPDDSFEAWQITGPRGWRFVSLPGGDLAAWSPSAAGLRQQTER
ncbi:DUF6188 family protein [Streptomyces sp. NPDC041003]|uniref:DUF6188 family protein n=1 Tax=Streptomyces sp. NPDC041003 TaxID=3155730 RepID=UPI0033F8453E